MTEYIKHFLKVITHLIAVCIFSHFFHVVKDYAVEAGQTVITDVTFDRVREMVWESH